MQDLSERKEIEQEPELPAFVRNDSDSGLSDMSDIDDFENLVPMTVPKRQPRRAPVPQNLIEQLFYIRQLVPELQSATNLLSDFQ